VYTSDGNDSGNWLAQQQSPVQEAPIDGFPYVRQDGDWAINTQTGEVLHYEFDAGLVGNPGTGNFRYNNADPSLVTELFFDDIDSTGRDVSVILLAEPLGSTVRILDAYNLGVFDEYTLDTIIDNIGYVTYNVTFVSTSGVLFTPGFAYNITNVSNAQSAISELVLVADSFLQANATADGFESVLNENVYATIPVSTESAQAWKLAVGIIEDFTGSDYTISWSGTLGTGATNQLVDYRVALDGVPIHELLGAAGVTRFDISGFSRKPITAGNHVIALEFRAASNATTATLSYAELSVRSL
jgi:hypothetical protein